MMIPTGRLELSEDEAYALLSLAMTSGMKFDSNSEKAVKKLAAFCKGQHYCSNHKPTNHCELEEAG